MSRNPQLASLGVNAVGYLRGGLGLGQAARLYVEALDAAGVPVRTTTVDVNLPDVVGPDGRRAQVKTMDFADLHVDGELPFNLVCVNAPELPALHAQLGAEFFENRYTIGVWAWEVDVVPPSWDRAFGLVDEIWVYSRYVQEIISNVSPVPVVRVPLPIVAPPRGDATALHLPDGFTFLFLFDFYSTLARKNPLGLVDAFTRAFAPGEGPQLVLKSHNGDFKPERLARLREAAGDRPDIHIVDQFLSGPEMAGLMRRADCYVSLHRAEGFGLTLGETMALGKPVIATGFSANLDFMTAENSYLVRHTETAVGPEGENYPAHGTWAEPDVGHAAQLMREVWEHQDEARARGARAQREIAEHFSLEVVGQVARERLKRLAGGHRRRRQAAGMATTGGDGDAGGLANSWVETAQLKLSFDPLRDARATGGAKGVARRAALAAMRPYTHHQDELSRFTVNGLREIDSRLDDLTLDTQAQIARLQALVRRSGAATPKELSLLVEGMRARPASTHPAISQTDEDGRRVLRFDSASSDAATYRGFEDIFRGDERAVLQQQLGYLPHFAGAEWVLDLGCGRGEFLDLLVARDIGARGADMDESMVARCIEKGHDVQLADAATYLRGLDDRSVPGMFAAQVVEHLGPEQLTELLDLMQHKLAPGGVAVMETVNPHNPAALKAFWTDTTHHHPLFPEVLLALCRLAGFESGEVRFPQEGGDFDVDVYVNRDYAVIVRTASPPAP